VKLRQTDKSQHVTYQNVSHAPKKGKQRSHKQHRGSITQHDSHLGSNTSIYHVDAANVPEYTWQHKGRPTLKKYKKIMLFVDHFRNQRPHLRPVDLNATMRSSHINTKLPSNHIMHTTEHSIPKHSKST
jgi:hypothetical protein